MRLFGWFGRGRGRRAERAEQGAYQARVESFEVARRAEGQSEAQSRVARAVAAASQAYEGGAGAGVGLGNARALSGAVWRLDAVERAAISGPLPKAQRRARRGLSTQLIWATARAAQERGRTPEEVWAEALRDWLASQEQERDMAPRALSVEPRRRQAWGAIEETLSALRAS